jgi:hypothetical protein
MIKRQRVSHNHVTQGVNKQIGTLATVKLTVEPLTAFYSLFSRQLSGGPAWSRPCLSVSTGELLLYAELQLGVDR